jgi:hypothetical protein
MDLTKLSDDDLLALKAGDLTKMSDQGLNMLKSSQPKQAEERTIGSELARQVGLTARAGLTGAAGLPLLAGDALNTLINKISGLNLQMPSQALQPLLTSAGLPQPQNPQERIAQEGAAALAGVGGTALLAKALAPKAVGTGLLTENIGLQSAGAIGGATAAGAGREYGDVGAAGQLGLAALGGMVAPTGVTAGGQAIVRGGREVARPFTEAGREVIVGNVLRQLANAPENLPSRLAAYEPTIPGYTPTTAQASRDVGLISAETAIRGLDTTGKFAAQASQANKARMTILDRLAKDKDAVNFAIAKREEVTAPLREQAFANSRLSGEDLTLAINNTVNSTIDNILASPEGKRGTVVNAMNFAKTSLQKADSIPALYEIRKDLRAASQGLLDKEGSAYSLANKQLNTVIKEVDGLIEQNAPGYRDYLRTYAGASKGIERLEAAQGFKAKVLSVTSDPINYGDFMISQPSFARAIRATAKETKLSEMQVRTLEKVGRDLDSGVLNRAGRVPGSDTFKNLSTANVIGGIIGKQMFGEVPAAANKVVAPLNWLYNGTDDQIKEILVDAMLDPKLASRLMTKASTTTVEPLSKELQKKAINMGYGAAFGLTGE